MSLDFLYKNLNWNTENVIFLKKLEGLNNTTFKIKYLETEYFLREGFSFNPNEIHVLKSLEPLNISPKLISYDPLNGSILLNWLKGETLTDDVFNSKEFISTVSKKLKLLHNHKPSEKLEPFNPIEDTKKRLITIKEHNLPLPEDFNKFLNHLKHIEKKYNINKDLVLCHNDLNQSNMLYDTQTKKLYFLDFEFVSFGDMFFDLGTLAWRMTPSSRDELLLNYFGKITPFLKEKLSDFIFVVMFWNAAWSLTKSINYTGTYDYTLSAKIIFEDFRKILDLI